MNQRLVKSIAQIISAMSDEERHMLDVQLQLADDSLQANDFLEEDKSFRVTEVTAGMKAFEEKHAVSQLATDQPPHDENDHFASTAETSDDEGAAYAFFRIAPSLNLDGPKDWSANIDHYLYGLPKAQDD